MEFAIRRIVRVTRVTQEHTMFLRHAAYSYRRARATLAIAVLAVAAPATIQGQGFDHTHPAPLTGPFTTVGRAGVRALTFPMATTTPPVFTGAAELTQRDTSGHHASRAHHAVVGALVGGAVGLVIGVIGDRPGAIGTGEMAHGSWHNLWLITAPFGAAGGAMVGALLPSD